MKKITSVNFRHTIHVFYASYFSKLKSPFSSNSQELSALCPVESVRAISKKYELHSKDMFVESTFSYVTCHHVCHICPSWWALIANIRLHLNYRLRSRDIMYLVAPVCPSVCPSADTLIIMITSDNPKLYSLFPKKHTIILLCVFYFSCHNQKTLFAI